MHLFFSRVFIGLSIGGAPGAESILIGVDMEKGHRKMGLFLCPVYL